MYANRLRQDFALALNLLSQSDWEFAVEKLLLILWCPFGRALLASLCRASYKYLSGGEESNTCSESSLGAAKLDRAQ